MKKLILAAAACLALAACSHDPATGGPRAPLAETTADERALATAVGAVTGAYLAAEVAVDSGLLKGEKAAEVAGYLRQADEAISVARAARVLGQDATAEARTAAAMELIAKAVALIPAAPPPH